MATRRLMGAWQQLVQRSVKVMTRQVLRQASRAAVRALSAAASPRRTRGTASVGAGAGDWLPGLVIGAGGMRRFRLYRPPGLKFGERLPLMVMLHGCGQTADSFAASTRMNRLAARERFLVLYPEQDRLANVHGCWNWFDTKSGRAQGEAALILGAIEQVCLLHPIDRTRVAVCGLSAGASMAALLVSCHPARFQALVMHSGIAPGTAHSALSALGAMHGHRGTAPLAATPQSMAACWPPLLVIHGVADAVVSAHNGRTAAQVWSDAAGARATAPRTVQRGQRHPMTVTDFKHGSRAVATLVEVARLGHAWSGGAAKQPFSDAQGPDASRLAWRYAAAQFAAREPLAA